MNARQVYGVVVLACLQALWGSGGNNDNRPEFELLCKFYKITQTPPTWSSESLSLSKTISDLELLNMSTSPEDWYNLFPGSTGTEAQWSVVRETPPFKGQLSENPDWQKNYDRWNELKKSLLEADSGKAQIKRAPVSPKLPQHHAKIERALEKVLRIDRDLESKRNELSALVQTIKTNLDEVLAGKGVTEGKVSEDSFVTHNNRRTSCKKNVNTGNSLANDITCLCSATGAANDQTCGSEFNSNGAQWDDGGTYAVMTAYGKVIQNCGTKANEITETNATIINHLLSDFTRILGRHAAGNADDNYILGKGNSQDCGGTASTDVCVSYKQVLNGATPKGILWIEGLKRVAHQLNNLDTKRREAQDLIYRAQTLEDSAHLEYEASFATIPHLQPHTGDTKKEPTTQQATGSGKPDELASTTAAQSTDLVEAWQPALYLLTL